MLRFGALISALAIGLSLGACSGGGGSIAFSDLPKAMLEARCAQQVRCGLSADQDYCLATTRPDPDPSTPAALAAKKLSFDGGRGQACVDAIKNLDCDLTASDAHVVPSECVEMYTGAVADGAACSIDTECASGTCDLPDNCPDDGCCVGMCHATLSSGGAGAACVKSVNCKDGLVCGADLTCHAPAKAGEACGSDRECGDKLACTDLVEGMSGTCRALAHAGEPCPFHRCADENQYCDEANTNTCVKFGQVGDPCPMMTGCATALECDMTTKRCRRYPTLNMACDGICAGDSFCADSGPSINTCIARLPNDQPCNGNQQCVSDFCQDGPVFSTCIDPYVCT